MTIIYTTLKNRSARVRSRLASGCEKRSTRGTFSIPTVGNVSFSISLLQHGNVTDATDDYSMENIFRIQALTVVANILRPGSTVRRTTEPHPTILV